MGADDSNKGDITVEVYGDDQIIGSYVVSYGKALQMVDLDVSKVRTLGIKIISEIINYCY